MYRAIPFVTFNDGNYVVNEECIEFLNQLKGPIGVISIAGKYRTGKSFFLNRCVLDEPYKSGFNVGSTIQACTKGIWMYTKTVQCADDSGSEFCTVVMDTEGIGALDADSTHDSRIFALALLLSSFFIYNSVGSIDENAVSNLSLVSNISKLIRVKSEEEPSSQELSEFLPSFMWMVRDFSLRLVNADGNVIDAQAYLEDALKGDERVRKALRSSFPKRQCATMVRPCVDEDDLQLMDSKDVDLRPAFVNQMNIVRDVIYKSVPRKTIMGQSINGSMLGALAKSYTTAINNGVAPVIKDSWELLSELQCRQCMDDCLEIFDKNVSQLQSSNTVQSSQILDECLDECIVSAKSLFTHNATESFRCEYLEKFENILKNRKISIHKINIAEIDKIMYNSLNDINDLLNDIKSVDELHSIFKGHTSQILTTLGKESANKWKCLVTDNVWTWIKIIIRKLTEEQTQLRKHLEYSSNNAATMNDEFARYKKQCSELINKKELAVNDLHARLVQHEESKSKLCLTIESQQTQLQHLENKNIEDGLLKTEEDKKLITELHQQLLDLTEECTLKIGECEIQVKVAQEQRIELETLLSQNQKELDIKCQSISSLMQDLKNSEENNYGAIQNNQTVIQLRENIIENKKYVEKQESDFYNQLKDLNNTTEDTITQVRQSALSERNILKSEIHSLKSELNISATEKERLEVSSIRKIEMLQSQCDIIKASEQELTQRYKSELDSSRSEIIRVSKQYQNQHESSKDMIKMLENHWQDDIAVKKIELQELRTARRSEQLELMQKLKVTESDLICSKTLLKDNKRRLADAQEKANNKKLKTEHDDIKAEYIKTSVQLECLKKTDRDTQEKIKQMELKNIKLERYCKDVERQREVDLLKMRLQYEKQIAALQENIS
jgi:hypothetical protein